MILSDHATPAASATPAIGGGPTERSDDALRRLQESEVKSEFVNLKSSINLKSKILNLKSHDLLLFR